MEDLFYLRRSRVSSVVPAIRVTGGPPGGCCGAGLFLHHRVVASRVPNGKGQKPRRDTKWRQASRTIGGTPHGNRYYGSLHSFRICFALAVSQGYNVDGIYGVGVNGV